MEDTLRDVAENVAQQVENSLNPCCNGRYSQSNESTTVSSIIGRLNPCCNGRYSQRQVILSLTTSDSGVLILVVMEDTLRESKTYESFVEAGLVFIRPIVPALVNRNQLLSKRMQR